jgi:hypothetical protein
LPIAYFRVVFSLREAIAAIAFYNRELACGLRFRAR